MALALSKTWNFTSRIYPYLGNTTTNHRNYHFGIKDIFLTMGWTVEGGRTAANGLHNNDQVDVMPTNDEANFGSGDIWMHMKAPPASPMSAEFVYASVFSNGHPTNSQRMNYYVSTGAGFGTVNGGGNGSTSSGPTATDQHIYSSYGTSTQTFASASTVSMYGAWTNDLKHFRLMMFNGQVLSQIHFFDIPNNPRADLDDGDVIHTWRHAGANTITPNTGVLDQDFYTSALYNGRVAGNNRALYLGSSGYANLGLQSHNTVLEDNKMIVHPVDVYNNTLGEKGYMGTIPDMYYGNNHQLGVLLGDSVGGSPLWISGGAIVTPWDPTEPRPRVY